MQLTSAIRFDKAIPNARFYMMFCTCGAIVMASDHVEVLCEMSAHQIQSRNELHIVAGVETIYKPLNEYMAGRYIGSIRALAHSTRERHMQQIRVRFESYLERDRYHKTATYVLICAAIAVLGTVLILWMKTPRP